MRALLLEGQRQTRLAEVSEPELLPGSVIIEIAKSGISRSDIVSYTTGSVPGPGWFGHEWSGRVTEIASGLDGRFVGERVVGSVPPPCGQCRPCLAGHQSSCELILAMILGTDPLADSHGAFAERLRVDARRLARIPEGVDDSEAALAQPAAVAAKAVTRAAIKLGDIVVIIGTGTIGLAIAELSRLSGAGRVAVLESSPGRRELACDLGADAAFVPPENHGASLDGGLADWLAHTGHGLGADVVFDCVGTSGSLARGVEMVRQAGTVVAVGVAPKREQEVLELTARDIVKAEVTIIASQGHGAADTSRVLALMAEDRLRLEPIIDPKLVPLAQVPVVLEDLTNGLTTNGGSLKRLVTPSGD